MTFRCPFLQNLELWGLINDDQKGPPPFRKSGLILSGSEGSKQESPYFLCTEVSDIAYFAETFFSQKKTFLCMTRVNFGGRRNFFNDVSALL